MELQTKNVRVSLTPNGFYPQALHWQGRALRILHVEQVQTAGQERRYRVRTSDGPYELGLHTSTGVWQVQRAPNWLDRARARLAHMPRYPLPAGRRRSRPAVQAVPARPAPAQRGGAHANWLALVRQ